MKTKYFICLNLCIVLLCGGCSSGSSNVASHSFIADETAKQTSDFSISPAPENTPAETQETTTFLCNFSNLTNKESLETVDALNYIAK